MTVLDETLRHIREQLGDEVADEVRAEVDKLKAEDESLRVKFALAETLEDAHLAKRD